MRRAFLEHNLRSFLCRDPACRRCLLALFDKVEEDDGPALVVYQRAAGGDDWTDAHYGSDDTYTTSLLPGFSLPVSPPDR